MREAPLSSRQSRKRTGTRGASSTHQGTAAFMPHLPPNLTAAFALP
jgi:hypothetical protein